MAEKNGTREGGITGITVSGFKSLRDESHIEVRPLTILAGANSSGKSSIIQPLLLMKQTLEAPYDPGALLLNGPNVKFTAAEQFLWKTRDGFADFKVNLETEGQYGFINTFKRQPEIPQIQLAETVIYLPEHRRVLGANMTEDEIDNAIPLMAKNYKSTWEQDLGGNLRWQVRRKRCFLGLDLVAITSDEETAVEGMGIITDVDDRYLLQMIHVPGLRPNPERSYPYSAVGYYSYPGTFQNYTASIIADMYLSSSMNSRDNRLQVLTNNLTKLGLTSHIFTKSANETQIEILVGRTLKSLKDDVVNIADVGFGVSQILHVLVALIIAKPGQLVYVEQPELHLHPRAQVALAQVLADAANRGVRVVVETHSALLIQGIQTLVAQEKLTPEKVILHWFARDDKGVTQINSQELDKYGAYGDWPEDFAEVQMDTDSTYLDAVEKRRFEELHDGQEPEMSGD